MKKLVLVSLIAGVTAMPALAYDSKDLIFRAGAAFATPNIDSKNFTDPSGNANGVLLNDADSETAFGGSIAWMVTPKIAVELQSTSPYTFQLTDDAGNQFADVDLIMPSVNVQYYFLEANSAIQPYVGVGANYTFYLKNANLAQNIAKVDFDDDVGLNAQIGMDYMITNNFGINASLSYMDVSLKGSYKENFITYSEKVDFDPVLFSLGGVFTF